MSGICTFLFTDIEGSTRRWEADPEAMRVALAAHDEVLRGTIATHKGLIFKHTGDGVCAVFASPRSAVDAAVAAQRALELPVRMGIATGEAELHAILRAAIEELPEEHRATFLLHDVEGLSNPEIAEALQIKTATVKSRVHRARLFLRGRLAVYLGGTTELAST